MDSLENSLVPHTPKPPLRLMRFSFEPNNSLLEETRALVHESRRPSTSIRFYASRQLLLQVPDFYRHEGSLHTIDRSFSAFNEPLHLAPVIRSKELKDRTTRFMLRAVEQDAFDQLTSLEVKPDKKFNKYATYDHLPLRQLPNEIEGQPETGHYLFVDIASSALVNGRERRANEQAFMRKAQAGRFFLHTIGLNTVRDIYTSPHGVPGQPTPAL